MRVSGSGDDDGVDGWIIEKGVRVGEVSRDAKFVGDFVSEAGSSIGDGGEVNAWDTAREKLGVEMAKTSKTD